MSAFEEKVYAGLRYNLNAEGLYTRQGELYQLMCDPRAPALLGLIEELRQELVEEVARYDRDGERAMDAGGLAALDQLKGRLREALEKPAEELETK